LHSFRFNLNKRKNRSLITNNEIIFFLKIEGHKNLLKKNNK
jgi:hypothetical protein